MAACERCVQMRGRLAACTPCCEQLLRLRGLEGVCCECWGGLTGWGKSGVVDAAERM